MAKNAFQKDPRRGDDRNLVLVDQDFGEPDLEDRMWLFWVRNKATILGGAVLVILGILGYIVWHAAGAFGLQAMQEEYQRLENTPEAKVHFARSHTGRPLAGVAALDAGDTYYKEKKYAEAAEAYQLAQKSFSPEDSFQAAGAGRALLGEAFTRIHAGETDAGMAVLQTLAGGRAYSSADRGWAMYSLALLALERQNVAEARQWLDAMDRDIDPLNPWQQKKQELVLYEPALMNPVKADAPAGTPEGGTGAPAPAPAPAQ